MGFLYLLLLFVASYFVDSIYKPEIEPNVVYDGNGNVIGVTPLPPFGRHLLGTDEQGVDMLYKLIDGAKYTIGLVILVSILRLTFSLFFGGLLSTRFFKKTKGFLTNLSDSFHYAPAALIVYVIAAPVVIVFSWAFTPEMRLILTAGALTLVAVPSLSLVIASEIGQINQRDFITNARLLGGSSFHIFRKHAAPYLMPRLLILFTQQFIQVLLLFAHLALLGLFMGGTVLKVTPTGLRAANSTDPPPMELKQIPFSHEWGGLIAQAIDHISFHRWLIYEPVIAMTITIFSTILIVEGMKSVFLNQRPFRRRRKNQKTNQGTDGPSFEFLKEKRRELPF